MKTILVIFMASLAFQLAKAQPFSIKGEVLDSLDQPLPSATVMLLNPEDSSLVNFGISDAEGKFELRKIARDNYLFNVTFVGFQPLTRQITLPVNGTVLDLGKLKMEVANHELDDVEVTAMQPPVVVKKDTIEFNAGSYKTKPNDNVEGLLKKMPGIDVDEEGTITAQGEEVKRVMVDGKEFFGRDPKLATRNLPADAVDKVQVFDKKSEQAEFTGIDDGEREKAINLELKEDRRNGMFGNVMAGAGTSERFQSKANINRFSKDQQWSLLGMGNNINEQGFSIGDYLDFTGGAQMASGGGRRTVQFQANSDNTDGVPLNMGKQANGILSNYAGGINLNKEFNTETELNGSYFFNELDHNISQETNRENFLPGGNFTYNQNSLQNNSNINHKVNAQFAYEMDPANSLRLTSTFSYNKTNGHKQSTSENIDAGQLVQNESELLNITSGDQLKYSSGLLFRHRFPKTGRTFSSDLKFGISENSRNDYSDGIYRYYGENPSEELQKQSGKLDIDNLSYGANLVYTEPLGGRKYLEASYHFSQNRNDLNREVFDLADEGELFNQDLSTAYNSLYTYHRGGLNFRLNRSEFNFQAGGSLQYTNLEGELKLADNEIGHSYRNILPAVHFNYDFTSAKHLRFDYETSVQEPSIQQLNPALDQTDQLNPYQGNPDLRPPYSHNWRLSYNTFNQVKLMSFFGFFDVNYTTNAITNSVTNDNFVRLTKPVNVDNNLDVRGNTTFFFPVQALKSRFSISANGREQHWINLLDGAENKIRQQTLGGKLRYDYQPDRLFDLHLGVELNNQETRYGFGQLNQTFFNQTYTAETNLSFLRHFWFNTEFNYFIYKNKSTDFNESIPMLNLSVSGFMLNKKGELKLSVNNLLDQDLGITQTATSNYVEQQITNSLGRYFMLSFTYAINKSLNPTPRQEGNMIRITR